MSPSQQRVREWQAERLKERQMELETTSKTSKKASQNSQANKQHAKSRTNKKHLKNPPKCDENVGEADMRKSEPKGLQDSHVEPESSKQNAQVESLPRSIDLVRAMKGACASTLTLAPANLQLV